VTSALTMQLRITFMAVPYHFNSTESKDHISILSEKLFSLISKSTPTRFKALNP